MLTFRKIVTATRLLLPILFLSYYINISFFTHVHIVNGVTIVHSHFYSQPFSEKGEPNHQHNSVQLQLIAQFSHLEIVGGIDSLTAPVFIPLLETICETLTVSPVLYFSFLDSIQFRGPPCLIA